MLRPRVLSAFAFAIVTGGMQAIPCMAAPPASTEPIWTPQQRTHWAYVAPKHPAPPAVQNRAWIRNPIDVFILNAVETMNLAPAPEADRPTLLRRLTYDLTGLPPTAEEVDAFLADTRPDAYERRVDSLLESTRYGERWGRIWLDLARYAESDGYKSDKTRPNAWRYRDWVIQALNADLPYDKFLTLQLAGDEVAPAGNDAFLATGFNRNYPFEDNNMVPGLNHQLILDDMTDTTTSVFLGMTVACARCHDHKYDPISQKDYYRIQALFAATEPRDDAPLASPFDQAVDAFIQGTHRERIDKVQKALSTVEKPYLAPLLKDKLAALPREVREAFAVDPIERSAAQEDLLKRYAKEMTVPPSAMEKAMKPVDRRLWAALDRQRKTLTDSLPPGLPIGSGMADVTSQPPPIPLRVKGNFALPGEFVPPGFPSVFAGVLPPFEEHPTANSSGRRKALAAWLARPDHPLTARVMVNRLWQNHFGRGLVSTPSDFGKQGAEPSHPELLDWLATEFIARNWSMKAMHRLMVTSATYRQSSTPPQKSLQDDPENTLYTRMFRRRLEGEAVRDSLLAVSGKLDNRLGGPSVFPDLPPGIETRGGWTRSSSESDRNRRSIYVFVRRNLKYPLFDAFDIPDTNTTCAERNISVNAPQALMLLNSELVLDQARSLAGRVLKSSIDRNDPRTLVTLAYRLTFSRAPSPAELDRGARFLEEQPALLNARAERSKKPDLPTPLPDGHSPTQGAALVDYCHVLLNLNEFVFVD